jgi:ketosteroid isomerase-like protein
LAVSAAERNRAGSNPAPHRSYDAYTISCTPTTATIVHRTTITNRFEGKDETYYWRGVHFLEKRGNRWLVVASANHPLDDAGVLGYIEREWNDANLKHDAQWVERNYAPDATEVFSRNGRIMTKSEVIEATKGDKSVLQSIDLSDLNIRTEGNTAVVTGIDHVVGRDAQGKPLDRRVSFTDVFIKRDGRWQVWATQATAIP